ncbi:MAG: TetR family transcriptional regulator [Alphaproteobacteria bacterium]|nr:TetR family transcriptional regulator [Alphaproteobacteria bacterium]
MPIVVDHEERRHYIARVVERVIAKQGMDAVTIRNVAREAGFRSTLISHYFKDKKEMLTFTLDSIRTRASIRVDQEFLENHDLATCIDTLLATNEDGLSDWQAWFGFWEKATFDPDLAAVRLAVVEATHNTLRRLLENGIARGELPQEVDVEFHARRLQIVLNGLAAHVVMKPSAWPAETQRALVKVEVEFIKKMPRPEIGVRLPNFPFALNGTSAS